MEKYFDSFGDREDVASQFQVGTGNRWSSDFVVAEDFPTDAEILFAAYGQEGYDGAALVVYERDGKLYEVNGSHCSCYGLEDQWQPEETSKAALAIRYLSGNFSEAAITRFQELFPRD